MEVVRRTVQLREWCYVLLATRKMKLIRKLNESLRTEKAETDNRKREREIRTRFKVFLSFLQGIKGGRKNEMLSNKAERRCHRMGICRGYVSQAEISINKAITFHIIEIGRRMILKRV